MSLAMQSMESDILPGVINPGIPGSSTGVTGIQIPASMPPFHLPPTSLPKCQSLTLEDLPQSNTRIRLHDIVKEFDANERLCEDVEDVLLELADDFVEATVKAACLSAKHRKSNVIEEQDVQLHLERDWNMWQPGFGMEEIRAYYKNVFSSEAHKRRMDLIRRSAKKS